MLLLPAVLAGACLERPPRSALAQGKTTAGSDASSAPSGAAATPAARGKPKPPVSVPLPAHALSEAEAAVFGLALVNRDRVSQGLPPVSWDETAAKAATRHARDLAAHGVTAHWGSDGSTPEMRYTEAGGAHLVTENAGCLADEKPRALRPAGPFEPASIQDFEDRFFNEKPPADGHRRNILEPRHTRVGIGFAGVEGSKVVCVVHEFVDDYGDYKPLPRQVKQGEHLLIEGKMRGPATFGGIGIAFEVAATPKTPAELGKTGGYAMPAPFVSYFPKGFVTPREVSLQGPSFSLDLPAGREKGAGEYVITIFAKFPGQKALVPVSMRTVAVP